MALNLGKRFILNQLQIIGILKVEPKSGGCLEISSEPNGGICCDDSALMNNLGDPRCWYVKSHG
jgi:hypothetical protein